MMRSPIKQHYTLLLLLLVLAGCSPDNPGAARQAHPAPWQTQLDALEKASGVESQILEADRERRNQIERLSQ